MTLASRAGDFSTPDYSSPVIRFFLRLLNYLLVVCFLSSIWGGWYLSKQGFGRKWRKKLSEEFAKRGVELTARRLTLDPLRGLVARNVRVYRDGDDHEETIAIINELRLDINYTRLLRNEPFLDALILSEAEVMLDVDPQRKKSGEFTIHNLTAQLYFQQDKMEIRRLQGEGLGLFFSIAGVLEHRPDWQTMTHPENVWMPFQKIPQRWLKALAEVKFGRKKGRLDLRFRGNLSQKLWLQSADARLEMPDLRWRGIVFQDLNLEADYADRVLTVRKCGWRDAQGALALSGSWRPNEEGHLLVDSRIDAQPIFAQANLLPEFTASGMTHINGDLSWKEEKSLNWQFVGKFAANQLVYRGVTWDHVKTQLSLAPNRWFLRELNLQQGSGALTGEILSDGDQVTAEIHSTVDPRSLWKMVNPDVPEWMNEFDFAVNPLLKVQLKSDPNQPGNLLSEGQIVFGRTSFRGVSLTSAQANFTGSERHLSLGLVQITRPEGQLSGEAYWDVKTGRLTIWDVSNSLDLVALGLWTNRALADVLETVKLPKDTYLQGNGTLTWTNSELTGMDLQIRSGNLAIAEIPVFQSLTKSTAIERSSSAFEGRAILEKGKLRVGPFSIRSSASELNGNAMWNLNTRRFSSHLQIENTGSETVSWAANSPMQEAVWRKESTISP